MFLNPKKTWGAFYFQENRCVLSLYLIVLQDCVELFVPMLLLRGWNSENGGVSYQASYQNNQMVHWKDPLLKKMWEKFIRRFIYFTFFYFLEIYLSLGFFGKFLICNYDVRHQFHSAVRLDLLSLSLFFSLIGLYCLKGWW